MPALGRLKFVLIPIGALLIVASVMGGLRLKHALNRLDRQLARTIENLTSGDNSIVLDRNGERIGELFTKYQVQIKYGELPPFLVKAILAIEDRDFFEHPGIDVKAMVRAALISLRHLEYRQGGSTISQQVVRSLMLTREKTISRKLREIYLAVRLEHHLSKREILALYTNRLFLGNGSYGVGAAARRYFGKPLAKLERHELALLAGLFQAPSRYDPTRAAAKAKRRQRQVLAALVQSRGLSRKDALALSAKPLAYVPYRPLNRLIAPYFIDFVRREAKAILGDEDIDNAGLRITTTLDVALQRVAVDAFAQEGAQVFAKARKALFSNLNDKQKDEMIQAALLSIDPSNGDVLAMVGGRDYEQSQFNRASDALRSPGSAFKPVIYSLALARGMTWAESHLLMPVAVDNYRPRNSDDEPYMLHSTLLRSFYRSINTAAVELGAKLGMSGVIAHATRLGVTSPLRKEAATLLGASAVTMPDMARMYASFANRGAPPAKIRAIVRIEDRRGKVLYDDASVAKVEPALSPEHAALMTTGLSAVFEHGTAARHQGYARIAAGKTGTSDNASDNWFCGYTSNQVTIVWLGSENHAPLAGRASASVLALPLWDAYMKRALTHRPAGPFALPPAISSAQVNARHGYLDPGGITMHFIKGTEPTATRSDFEAVRVGGTYRTMLHR